MNLHPSHPELPPAQPMAARIFSALERFLRVEAASGIVLLIAAAAALIWANSPAAESYQHFWHTPVTVALGGHAVSKPLHFLINDGLMTVFFLVVGMEIRRESHEGALASLRLAALPLAAAAGGVAVPALIYLAMNVDPLLARGWAVPTATDIAFAVGVLALLGKSIPSELRVLLLALAIIDDIAAVAIIALFYSGGLDVSGLLIAGSGLLLVWGLQRIGIGAAYAYILPGAILWGGLLQAGLHPTLAGVTLGLMTPVLPLRGREAPPPVVRVQVALHPWVAFGIMPLFALANAGVNLEGMDWLDGGSRSVLLGAFLALFLGKPIGILLGSWIGVRLGWCRLPSTVTWRGIVLIGCLGGIGFTMAIFIATLAFTDASLLAAAKSGVLFASLAAGIAGLALGRTYSRCHAGGAGMATDSALK